MSNSNSSKQVLLSVIGVAILVVAVVGVSFAFFNYTRTGTANQVSTGTITFTSSNSAINVTNVFPIAKSTVGSDTTNVGTGTVTINGNTNYSNGIDFQITAESVSSNIGTAAGKLPVSIAVSSTNTTDIKAYQSNSGSIQLTSYEDGTTISSGSVLAQGRIPANATVTNAVITIKAYLDDDVVAITDTYNASGTPTDENGTTSTWVDGRTVLTTTQWNALASTPASFKIKVVANEGSA